MKLYGLISVLFVISIGLPLSAQLPDLDSIREMEAETISREEMTRLNLRGIRFAEIKDLEHTVDDMVKLIETKAKEMGRPVSIIMGKPYREMKITLKVKHISALTLLMIIKEQAAIGEFRIEGTKIIFKQWIE